MVAVLSSNIRRILVAGLVALATIAASITMPSTAAAEDIVVLPVEGLSQPIVVDGGFNVSYPIVEDKTQAAPQCTEVPGLGRMCFGSPTPTNSAPLEVVGPEHLAPLVKDGKEASEGLDWIVAEGQESVRALYDIPADDRIGRYARSELRSYLVERLLDIMDRKVYGLPLSEDEQAALQFVESELLADDLTLAQAAWDEFARWRDVGCGYHAPAAPASVAKPVLMPKKVADWCSRAHHPSSEAFMFAPPMPSVDEFTAWGAYRQRQTLGLDALSDSRVAANARDMALTSVVFAGLAAAIGAAGVTAAIVGTTAALSGAVVALIGSHAAMTTWVFGGPAIAGATAGVGAAAAAAVVAVVMVFVVVTAVSIWLLVQNEAIGKTLKTRLDDALEATDPLGLGPLTAQLSGQPLRSQFDPASPPSYRTAGIISKLMAKVALWTSVDSAGVITGDAPGVWPGNATTARDYQFVKRVGTGDPVTVTSVSVPQQPGYANVRFNRGWMVFNPADEDPKPALSFGYINADGKDRMASRAPSSIGGWIVTDPAAPSATAGTHVDAISFRDANNRLVRVRIKLRGYQLLSGPRPAAVGPMVAGRIVNLRPNPVNVDGTSVDLAEAQADYTYKWTVRRFNSATGEWDDHHSSSAFGPSFAPAQTGLYDARVVMKSVEDPLARKFGMVAFTVAAPPMTPTTLALLDNGSSHLEVDLQITEPVISDSITVDVVWPRNFGASDDPTTSITLDCIQTGPLECTTPRTGLFDNLTRDLTSAADLRLPVTVTLTNGSGGRTTLPLAIDTPIRPVVGRPQAGVNTGLSGSVLVGDTTTQVEMPLGPANETYVAGTLLPGTGAGDDFGLVDPTTQNTVANLAVPGLPSVHVSVDERGDGTWELLVWGHPSVRDLGVYEVPVVVQQTNTNRAAIVVVVHVVPSKRDRYRGALQSEVNPFSNDEDTPPDLRAVVLGGLVSRSPYTGDMCLSLQYAEFGAPPVEKCGALSTFFTATGTARRFPYAEFFPTGMQVGTYRATARLTTSSSRVDTQALTTAFFLTEAATYAPPQVQIGAVSVSGNAKVGALLQSAIASINPSNATLTYQWHRDGVGLTNATAKNYVVRAGDVGHRLSVKVVASKADWVTAVRFSGSTALVKP